jgi:predicted aldo/keto reductase-like oxidoreductase
MIEKQISVGDLSIHDSLELLQAIVDVAKFQFT